MKTLKGKVLVRLIDESRKEDSLYVVSKKLDYRGTSKLTEHIPAEVISVSDSDKYFRPGDSVLINPWVGRDVRIDHKLTCLVDDWAIEAILCYDKKES
jgi:hypothetical protein